MNSLSELCQQIHELTNSGVIINSENNDNSPVEVIIKPDQFDASKIKEYEGEEFKEIEFQPQTFEQFIGQEEAKESAKTIIKKANKGLKAHFFVDGIRGHGKTSYVELIAKQLDAHLIERIGKQVNVNDLVNIINEINICKKKHVMFFVDEIDTMDKDILKVLNPIIQFFKIAGKRIQTFIFVGATINKHMLIKNNPDTLDRIPPTAQIKFVRYNSAEIAQIINQYKEKLYSDENIPNNVIQTISKNCKFNPRTSIALMEDYIVEKDIWKILKTCHIVKDGLTKKDIDILRILNISKKPMGADALAMKVKLNKNEYVREFEPFLVEYDFINREPSRVITEKGKDFLNKIKYCN